MSMDSNQNIVGLVLDSTINAIQSSGLIDWINTMGSQDPLTVSIQLMLNGGWVIFVIVLMWVIYQDVFLDYRSGQFMGKWKHILMAIDLPKNNEQTPKAVENIFAALAGAYTSPNLLDKYWTGKVTESFSFEIVSIEGHTRFLVRTPSHFRDFIESVMYSQYPEAEINEVSDYTEYDSDELDATGKPIPFRNLKFPSKMYNLWGAEFVLVKPYPYPIRTYIEFEHQATQTFIDPMASLLEVMSKIGNGEQLWLQFVIQPQPPGWGEEAKKVVSQIQGKDYKAPEKFDATQLISGPANAVGEFGSGLLSEAFGVGLGGATEKKKEEDQWKMFKISPGERDVLIKVERKLSKQAFKVKFRMIYLGKKEVFAKGRGVTGVTGSLQQFNTADSNAFKPGGYSKTAADYFFVDRRIATKQNRILRWFSNRSAWYGETNASSKLTLLNPEELATLWHFPVMTVKASQLEMIGSKKSAPPTRLPYQERAKPAPKKEERQAVAPIRAVSPLTPGQTPSARPIPVPVPMQTSPDIAPVMPQGISLGAGIDGGHRKSAPPTNLPLG